MSTLPRPRILPLALLALVAALTAAKSARADWAPLAGPGVTVCDAPAVPNTLMSAPDGNGGVFVSWLDRRSGTPLLFARHVTGLGVALAPDDGSPVNAARIVDPAAMASDGAGGVILVWRDERADTAGNLYAQRLNPDGSPAWSANGIAVNTGPLHEREVRAAADGAGGVFVLWSDDRSGVQELRSQRLDANGNLLWAAGGVVVATTLTPYAPVLRAHLAADGTGGLLVGWSDTNLLYLQVKVQRLSSSGAALWPAGGVSLSTSTVGVALYDLAADGTGGALAAIEDNRSQNSWQQAFAQRVDASGHVAWAADGVSLSGPAAPVEDASVIADATGGAIVSWRAYPGGGINSVYAQRIAAAGAKLWTPAGVLVGSAFDGDGWLQSRLLPDGAGGALFAWNGERDPGAYDVVGQRLAGDGSKQWLPDGRVLASLAHIVWQLGFVPDASGGGVASWLDTQNFVGTYTVAAERIAAPGTLPVPAAGPAHIALAGIPSPARARDGASVRFTLAQAGNARVRLFDLAGRQVRQLFAGTLAAGDHQLAWDGRDATGARVRPGLYLITLESASGRSGARWVVTE